MNDDLLLFSILNSINKDENRKEYFVDLLSSIDNLLTHNTDLYAGINRSNLVSHHFFFLLQNENAFQKTLEFFTKHLQNLKLPEIYFSKTFIFFITEKLYENMFVDYTLILNFVEKFVTKYYFIINLLYECGFFCLLNGIIDTRTCKIYNIVFKDLVYCKSALSKDNKPSTKCFYEIHRKQFDSEIIFSENNTIILKEVEFYKKGTVIHQKIYEDLVNSSFYNLLVHDFDNLISVINYKQNECKVIQENENLFRGCLEGNPEYLRIYRMNFFEAEKFIETSFYKKISRFIEDKNFRVRYETILCFCLCSDLDTKIKFSEKKIRCIFQMLEFNITECIKCEDTPCDGECTLFLLLNMLEDIYRVTNKLWFYKISYLILIKQVSTRIVHSFIFEYYKDILIYFRTNKNNISRVLFPYQKKTKAKEDVKDTKELLNDNKERNEEYGEMQEDYRLEDSNELDSDSFLC